MAPNNGLPTSKNFYPTEENLDASQPQKPLAQNAHDIKRQKLI